MSDIINWVGKSGQLYRYWILTNITMEGIQAAAGNYAFVKQLPSGNFVPLYFGETENLRDRILSHDRWDEARRAGLTHVMGHTTPAGAQARLSEERDLIQQWNPPLNAQHRKVS
jgi:hypothetical protein